MTNWNLGTVGFGYKDWEGNFYPPKTPQREYLKHYSQIFNSVEIDSSFYGCPSIEQLKKWKESTPEAFKFCLKTPRLITHDLHLLGVEKEMRSFLEVSLSLEEKLGAILIQLPPSFSFAKFTNLRSFLEKLPAQPNAKTKLAIELRHESWYESYAKNKFIEYINEHARANPSYSIAWVANDYSDIPKEINPTSDFLYLRWIGKHNRYPEKTHERLDLTDKLQWWQEEISKHLETSKEVYGYFNNDYSGHSPSTCNKLKGLLGLKIEEPEIIEQASLF